MSCSSKWCLFYREQLRKDSILTSMTNKYSAFLFSEGFSTFNRNYFHAAIISHNWMCTLQKYMSKKLRIVFQILFHSIVECYRWPQFFSPWLIQYAYFKFIHIFYVFMKCVLQLFITDQHFLQSQLFSKRDYIVVFFFLLMHIFL